MERGRTPPAAAACLSWVVYHRAYHPAFADRVPYNVVVAELDEGPRLITNVVGIEGGEGLAIEMPVELQAETEGDSPSRGFAVSSPTATATRTVAAGAAFAGDRIEPAVALAASGLVDDIALECLAERTIVAGLRARRNNPEAGPTCASSAASRRCCRSRARAAAGSSATSARPTRPPERAPPLGSRASWG